MFALGSGLAAVAGVVLGAMTSLHPQMGLAFVIDAFIVIVIGGLGSFKGAIVGSLLLGQVQSFGVALLPEFTNPNKESSSKRTVGIVMVVAAAALLLGYVLPAILRRSRAAQATQAAQATRARATAKRQVKRRKR